jgi:HK97 family phage prohead protease
VSYIITDIDGTLTTSGDTPRQDYIDWLKTRVQDFAAEVIVVSARNIDRLAETEKWLETNGVPYSQIFLQDFGESNPAVNEAFKAYKYSKLQEQYGAEIELVVDNDAEARDAAEGMGIDAYTPEEILNGDADNMQEDEDETRVLVDVPDYISLAAQRGLEYYDAGMGGEGLVDATIEEARQLRAGKVEDEKLMRMRPWILRHRQDWEGVPQNSDAQNEAFPGPGAVAAYLWGVEPTAENGADRVLQWIDSTLNAEAERFDVKEFERRALPMGDFTVTDSEDGQKTFTGYAAMFNTPSAGLPFTEVIAPGAFKRTLSRAAAGSKFISFLFGHDETRALATTASGRLTLEETALGLRVEAKLDPADPVAQSVISQLTNEAAAMGMSFGFSTPKGGDVWEGDKRTIREVNLFEVSVLSAGQTPAYPATLGLTAVRKLSADKIGIDAERLMNTLESIKAAKELTDDELEVVDQVRSKLAPKGTGISQSLAAAKLKLAQLESETL